MKKALYLAILVSLLYACSGPVTISPIHITSHDQTFVITDPSKGYNSYPTWAVFPGTETDYRKIILNITYACPDTLHCGEWDYVDNIYINRINGLRGDSVNIELARMISPYGWFFDSTWVFTWKVDISDYAILLRDSVEISFRHSGYENNTDRGWLVTLDFEIHEGPQVMECLGWDTLFQGNYPYGDSSDPIENWLTPKTISNRYKADIARLRIIQTGHGMDDFENCAEFCSKWRKISWNGQLVDQREIWRECSTNPLYPQAGTWIFDRAGWCPGEVVYPETFDLPLDNEKNNLLIEMEPYINPNNPSAKYNISALVIYYKSPASKSDVTLQEIVSPDISDKYSRMNPICCDPKIIIKNNGSEPLNRVDVIYGLDNRHMQSYEWKGDLKSQMSTLVNLPGNLDYENGSGEFTVILKSPNGRKDEYPADNMLSSVAELPPVLPTQFILKFRTNNDSSHNACLVTNASGEYVVHHELGKLGKSKVYTDTLNLVPGCYNLYVSDTAGDGLDFWFHPEAGYGYVRLLDMNGHLIKSFGSDFGSEIRYAFVTREGAIAPESQEELPLVKAVPARNYGIFDLEIFNNDPADVNIHITNADSTKIILDQTIRAFKEGFLPFDITAHEDGIYRIYVEVDGKTVMKRIRMKRS